MPSLTWAQVFARRLERHFLVDGSASTSLDPAVVARRICGAHAQIMGAAEVSVAMRTPAGIRADVQDALLVQRTLIKTFGPRGTVHLLPTDDLPMWTGALSAVPTGPDGLPADLRLSADETDQLVAVMAESFADRDLTFDELGEVVIGATGPWAGALVIPAFNSAWPRWRRALIPAARRGVLCFGPDRGRNVTYTSPRRWLPGFMPADPNGAIRDLVRQYLAAYGPATPAQFAQWLAGPKRWAADLFHDMGSELTEVDVEGTRAWLATDDLDVPSLPPRGVRLLPYFDAYTVGTHPRDIVFPGVAHERALSRGQAGNVPVLLVDGIVGGIWHQRRSVRLLDVRVYPFLTLSADQLRGLDAQVGRLRTILGADARITIGPVEAGRHL